MKSVFAVLKDCGDGSSTIEWYKDFTREAVESLCDPDKDESYSSGDGLQITELKFPDEFDLNSIKGIYWSPEIDDDDLDYYPGDEIDFS